MECSDLDADQSDRAVGIDFDDLVRAVLSARRLHFLEQPVANADQYDGVVGSCPGHKIISQVVAETGLETERVVAAVARKFLIAPA